jgi:hypothetical protein
MHMGIDKARHRDQPLAVDLPLAAITLISADDALAANGNVAGNQLAGHQVQKPGVLDDDVRILPRQRLVDAMFQKPRGYG